MSCTYNLKHNIFGLININECARSKAITIRFNSEGAIRISAPQNTPTRIIEYFIDNNKEKILKYIEKIKSKCIHKKTIFCATTQFSTRDHNLIMTLNNNERVEKIHVGKGKIEFSYNNDTNFDNENIQELIHRGINFALKVEAQKYLPQRVSELSQKVNLKFESIHFRNMKTRWGSCCKQRKIICLNTQLMRLPQHLIDYVIIHEMGHLIEANHGRHFHEIVNFWCNGNEKLLDNELKKYSCTI